MIITIGRQTGSGGHIIAKKLAENLGLKFCDKELLDMAAVESGFDKKFFERTDEKRGFFHSLFGVTVNIGSFATYGDGLVKNNFSQESLFSFQAEAIRKAADEGGCLFVGRCADYVLRDRQDLLNIFITADMDERIDRVAERMGITHEQAAKLISEKEAQRSSYYNYYTGKKWGYSSSYDLCINSSILGLEKTEEYIRNFILLSHK